MNRLTGPASAGRHRQQSHRPGSILADAEPDRPLFAARSDPSWDETRDRLVTLLVEGLLVLVPCIVWYLHAGPHLTACGLAPSSSAASCSGAVSQYVVSLVGLIFSGLGTLAAVVILLIKASQ